MINGTYRTKAGSKVTVSGVHSGRFDIEFEWLEEQSACFDCQPAVEDDLLVWSCDGHEGSSAELMPVEATE